MNRKAKKAAPLAKLKWDRVTIALAVFGLALIALVLAEAMRSAPAVHKAMI